MTFPPRLDQIICASLLSSTETSNLTMASIEHAQDKQQESSSDKSNYAIDHNEDVERMRRASFNPNADLSHVLAGDERAVLTEADVCSHELFL